MSANRQSLSPAQVRAARMRGNVALVATIATTRQAIAAATINAEDDHYDRLHSMRSLGFGQRSSLCG